MDSIFPIMRQIREFNDSMEVSFFLFIGIWLALMFLSTKLVFFAILGLFFLGFGIYLMVKHMRKWRQ